MKHEPDFLIDSCPGIDAHFARLLAEYCRRRGVSRSELLRISDVEYDVLDCGTAHVDRSDWLELLRAGADLLWDPDLGLQLGFDARPGDWERAAELAHGATLRSAIVHAQRCSALLGNAYRLHFGLGLAECHRCMPADAAAHPESVRLDEQFSVAAWAGLLRWMAGPCASPSWIALRQRRPRHAAHYETLLDCEVRFEQGATVIAFEPGLLDEPVPQVSAGWVPRGWGDAEAGPHRVPNTDFTFPRRSS